MRRRKAKEDVEIWDESLQFVLGTGCVLSTHGDLGEPVRKMDPIGFVRPRKPTQKKKRHAKPRKA